MNSAQRIAPCALILTAAIILTACARQKEPAQKLLSHVDATVAAASAEAAKYVPEQLAEVQDGVRSLKASFDKQDYQAVVTAGPPVLSAAQGLATAAAARKDDVLKAQDHQWTSLSRSLPAAFTSIQERIELLSRPSQKKMAAGIDLALARSSLDTAASLWSKAQGAFASGSMDEAVDTANEVKAKIDALAASLKVDLPPPAGV